MKKVNNQFVDLKFWAWICLMVEGEGEGVVMEMFALPTFFRHEI